MRFEHVDGKFWEIDVTGKRVTLRFGKLGAVGQTQIKDHPTPKAAKAAHDAAVKAKFAEGYATATSMHATAAHAGRAPVAVPKAASNPALEKAIADEVDGIDAYLVYGDWLQAQGDPRGELISIQHARIKKPKDAALARAEQTILRAHAEAIYGPLRSTTPGRRKAQPPAVDVEWHLGFLRGARINADGDVSPADAPELLNQLLALPVARFLRSLGFAQVSAALGMAHYPLVTAVLAKYELPFLRELRFGDFPYGDDWEVNWGTVGDLTKVLRRSPRLEQLSLRGGDIRLGKPVLPELRELLIESDSSTEAICSSLEAATFPKLQRLELIMGPNSGKLDRLGKVFDGKFPALEHLHIEWCDPTKKQLELLGSGKTLPKLKTLSLPSCALTDRKSAVITAAAERYKHLESIDFDNNLMSKPTQKTLAKLCKKVRFGQQQRPDDLYEWT